MLLYNEDLPFEADVGVTANQHRGDGYDAST